MIKSLMSGVAVLALTSGAALAQTSLKMAFFASPKDPTYSQVIMPWINTINAEAKGAIKIDAFPGGALGRNPRLQVKMTLDGVADLAWTVPAYTPGRFPDNQVMELPTLIHDVKESSVVFRRLYEKGLLRGYDDFYVPLLVTTHPYFINTVKPVTKIGDLKGMKLRAGGPVAGASMRALGAVPVGMPIPAVAENISKGILNGSAAEWNVMYAFRIVEVAKHHYMARLGTVPLAVLFNKKKFDGLPANVRAIINKHSGEKFSRKFGDVHFAIQGQKLALTQKRPDHKFVFPSKAALAKWDATLTPVITDWEKKHPKGKMLLGALNKELADYRAGK
ncbi:MAG: TRAP transporter substrate-binding protein [Rhodospirillaceae bacterium]|nr:TRAP transporter substrate-binding protein [Rhodospirillaceae bacterium]MBT3884033.1 TRAP transporter substrate-binding protein [Rhodospirillaceae bacterium]MBT4118617.1 TRAP transporter substrate-binding protein [Rhodospirillaceae bacterium]MBT4674638.1 TRAP transporter substrate-binding protein [Rhodospirillaceae bacterium]MBT4719805.1 TRAP transporter substrate-binding protein [Rhodospirillaceae bacterium]